MADVLSVAMPATQNPEPTPSATASPTITAPSATGEASEAGIPDTNASSTIPFDSASPSMANGDMSATVNDTTVESSKTVVVRYGNSRYIFETNQLEALNHVVFVVD